LMFAVDVVLLRLLFAVAYVMEYVVQYVVGYLASCWLLLAAF
jgi:phage shock protein PspC (stress-responsive transcriptional regulator)